MFRIAYRIPDVAPRACKESPQFRRLKQQAPDGDNGKWTCFEHPEGGTLAIWPSAGAGFDLADFGEPRQCLDGLTYYPSKDVPDLVDLLKPELARPADGDWVQLTTGADIWIATAVMSERRWILSANGSARTAPIKHAYGILARRLHAMSTAPADEFDGKAQGQLEIQLIIAAIHTSYDITDEMIEDLEAFHLSDVDIAVIRGVAWGLSPKESAAGLLASRSASLAAESQTSPLPPQNQP